LITELRTRTDMRVQVPLLLYQSCLSWCIALHFQPSHADGQDRNIYVKNRLDRMCNSNGSKTRINVKQEVVSVFSFNSSLLTPGPGPGGAEFRCHLELYLPSSSYGFSVFIEEMSLSGSLLSGCHHDYVQFGRDILFVTTHLSQKYCGDVELPVPRSKNGVTSFDFPFTPLARRIYNEEEDREMDIWINIDTGRDLVLGDTAEKTLTLVVTPFKKSCATRDSLYQQCRFSTKCVRRELFCDGRINCAWPYIEPADEVHCLESLAPAEEPHLVTDVLVILAVVALLAAMMGALGVAVSRYSGQTKLDQEAADTRRQVARSQGGSALLCDPGDACDPLYQPSCPPAPSCPPPPPYTAVDSLSPALPAHPPPSYSLLMPTRST